MNPLSKQGVRMAALLLFSSLCLATSGLAQTVSGRVTTVDRQPLELVQVIVEGLDRGTVSGPNGRWLLDKLPLGTFRLEFRFVGFRTESRMVEVVAGETKVDVMLRESRIDLEETIITAEGQADAMLKRSTRSVSILAPEDLDRSRGQTLGAMLAELPGVSVLSTGPSIAKPVIRGLHSQRLVVVNAGVQLEGQQWEANMPRKSIRFRPEVSRSFGGPHLWNMAWVPSGA